eukprot:GHVN01028000.1.p2 GENE.GHVN01028000.1~~GHVN01028000.1.p2  ORF type:complete len:115 (-),score=6.01 GHVN01028000.1:762-1106(-)
MVRRRLGRGPGMGHRNPCLAGLAANEVGIQVTDRSGNLNGRGRNGSPSFRRDPLFATHEFRRNVFSETSWERPMEVAMAWRLRPASSVFGSPFLVEVADELSVSYLDYLGDFFL